VIKLWRCTAATLLLAILAATSATAMAQDGPPGPYKTTTTLSVTGKPVRGATITLTAVISGDQTVYNPAVDQCNAYPANVITIYNGNTQIGTAQLINSNATATVNLSADFTDDYECSYVDTYWTTATSYTMTYKIPQNSQSVNFRAVFASKSAPAWAESSQSATLTYKFPSIAPVLVNLLFNGG
jgi:hypothetical protein